MVMLGLGTDGHTASIFPNQMELLKSATNCVTATHPDSGQKRVSLSGPIINNAKHIAFLVTGSAKADKVQSILKKDQQSLSYPAAFIEPLNGSLFWFMDREAAGLNPK
jgi:6-phosphogluconolactonase